MGRITEWLDRNQQRILWLAFFISMGYWSAGIWGAVSQILLFGFIISLSVIKPLQRFSKVAGHIDEMRESVESIEESVTSDRLVYVRIQEPHALIVPLRAGGRLHTMTWQDVDVAAYETYPEEALQLALEEYDGYKISHYVEDDPERPFGEGSEIPEREWIEVVPERDLPQEEE